MCTYIQRLNLDPVKHKICTVPYKPTTHRAIYERVHIKEVKYDVMYIVQWRVRSPVQRSDFPLTPYRMADRPHDNITSYIILGVNAPNY